MAFALCTGRDRAIIAVTDPSNAGWAGPVSALRWVPLSAYATVGKPATCSKRHAVQRGWGIARWRGVDFIRTRYRQLRFSTSVQEIWRSSDIHWPTNEVARTDHCPYTNILGNHKTCLILLSLLSGSRLKASWPLQCSDKTSLPIDT
jgi:hypothetical protein